MFITLHLIYKNKMDDERPPSQLTEDDVHMLEFSMPYQHILGAAMPHERAKLPMAHSIVHTAPFGSMQALETREEVINLCEEAHREECKL